MDKKLVACLLLLAIASGASLAISSAEAESIANPYLLEGEKSSITGGEVKSGEATYWFVYFRPRESNTARNLLVCVLDDGDTGKLEMRDSQLRELHEFDYDYSALKQFASDNKLSYQEIASKADAIKQKIDAAKGSYQTLFVDQVEKKYASSGIDFTPIETKLESLSDTSLTFSSKVEDGLSIQANFESDQSLAGFTEMLIQYNSTLNSLQALSGDLQEYQDFVTQKHSEVVNSQLTYDQKSEILSALQKVYDIIPDDLQSETALQKSISTLNRKLASSTKAVEDSVASFKYRVLKKDAETAYADAKTKATQILESEQEFYACGITLDSFKRQWNLISSTMQSTGVKAETYAQVPSQVSSLKTTMDDLDSQYQKCLNGPDKKKTKQTDYTPYFVVAGIGIVALGFYLKKKKQDDEQEEEIPEKKEEE